MNPERGPRMSSPEEIKQIEKKRALSDAELIKDGAEWSINDKGEKILEITTEQQEKLAEKEAEDKKAREEHEQHKKEMEEKEKEVKEEIEKKFRDALESLYNKIQPIKEPDNEFPSGDKLRDLIEEIPLFAQMQEGGKRMFVKSLESDKGFRSPILEVFVEEGMDALSLFIHIAILKEGGNRWLQERQEKREVEAEQPQPEKLQTKEVPEEEASKEVES